ncbi:MAG TPA: bacillithiol biosynthesis deacetylase BshB1 [bacterium]|nr:bacillithiol biosynthesis deacetylase BshB1 [bacterium]
MAEFLVIGAHPDDAEIGMGGTIAALGQQGHHVTLLDLTNGEPTPMGTPERRREEGEAAARALGVARRITLPLPNRYLADTVENRMAVAEVIREVRPEILFIPYWVDAHPDHVAAEHLAEAARFYGKLTKTEMRGEPFYVPRILHFFCTHYRLHVDPAFVLDITDQIDRKLGAIACYRTQFNEDRGNLGVLDAIRTVNHYWGSRIRRPYGEAFASKEAIGLRGLGDLL